MMRCNIEQGARSKELFQYLCTRPDVPSATQVRTVETRRIGFQLDNSPKDRLRYLPRTGYAYRKNDLRKLVHTCINLSNPESVA